MAEAKKETTGTTGPNGADDDLPRTAAVPEPVLVPDEPVAAVETAPQTAEPPSSLRPLPGGGDGYELVPSATWPPPIFVRSGISVQERYYLEHRWYSQWSFFDKRATQNKNSYMRLQLIIGVGSVVVPVLVGIPPSALAGQLAFFPELLYLITVTLSLAVAVSAAIENINKYGDNWRSYRNAAEELQQEKAMYDTMTGSYSDPLSAFSVFVERCEDIIAQQNGRWVRSREQQQFQAEAQAQEFVDKYVDRSDKDKKDDGDMPLSVG